MRPLSAHVPSSGSSQGLHLFLLGTFRVAIGSHTIDDAKWRRRKASALVKILALTPTHSLHREQVIDLLWPDVPPERGANNFHQVLYLARHILDSTRRLRLEDDFLTLSPDEPLWIDVEAFEAAAEEARRHPDPTAYRRALDLYGGELLPEDRYAEWASARRDSLHEEYVGLWIGLAEIHSAMKDYEGAVDSLKQVVAIEPAHERAHRTLMELYAQMGKREQALAQFEHLRGALRKELDAEPDDSSLQLHQQILAGKPRPPQAAPKTPLSNLPIQLTSFIGREQEMDAVRRLLASARLLTLTGPGGCGKTRLALEVAGRAIDMHPDGVWFVDLAPLSDAAFVPRVVANVLGVPEPAGKSVTETLTTFLQSRQLLILLDNCEHLADACARFCNTLLQACPHLGILATSREPLRISGEIVWLVPSLSLPDLDHLPPVRELMDLAAIRLFVERARSVLTSFELTPANAPIVARLCFHLDGIPLAIELAAARVSVLSVEQILARLNDRFRLLTRGSRNALNRQQTLRAAIDWSYDTLSEQERTLFRQLAVFTGGWTLEAAEAVCRGQWSMENPPFTLLDMLAQLVDKSLVLVEERDGEAHYRMLETIREYARERLDASGEAQTVTARHSAWCIALLEETNPRLWGADHIRRVNRLESAYENMRTALAWCMEQDPLSGLRLAILLEQFWILRGYAKEGRGWLERLLTRVAEPATLRAKGLLTLVRLRAHSGGYRGEEENALENILSIYGQFEDRREQVRTYQFVGGMTFVKTSQEKAKPFFEASLALARETGFQAGIACAEHCLGIQSYATGDYEQVERWLDKSITHLRGLGDEPDIAPLFLNINQMPFAYGVHRRWRIVDEENFLLIRHFSASSAVGYALANQGNVARAMGEHARAATLYEASRAHFAEIADQSGLSQVLGQIGYLFALMRDDSRARAALESSLALRRELGNRRGIGRSLHNLANAAILGGDYVHARAWLDESLDLFQEIMDEPGLAQTFNHLGNWALEQDDFALAETFYEKGLNLFAEFGNRGAGRMLLNLAECALGTGDADLARARLERARAALNAYGDRLGAAAVDEQLKHLADAERARK